MIPEVDHMLSLSAAQLMGTLLPQLPDGYAQGQAMLLSVMMAIGAQEYGRAADVRASENADMRTLFRELAPDVGDKELRARLEAAAGTRDETLVISALNTSNAELRSLLIALQTIVEQQENREAQLHIWDVLKRSAERRLVTLA